MNVLLLPVSYGEGWSSRCIRKIAGVSLPAFLGLPEKFYSVDVTK